jgi:hypothetical protein
LTIRVKLSEATKSALAAKLFSGEDEYLLGGIRKADKVEVVTPSPPATTQPSTSTSTNNQPKKNE